MKPVIGVYGYVMQQFEETILSYQEIADGADMSRRTVEKIARKEIGDPGVSHCDKLAAFFRSQKREAA